MGGHGFTGSKQVPDISDQVAVRVLESVVTTVTTSYVAVASPGTLATEARWSVRKVVADTATGLTIITWAEKDFGNGLEATARFVHAANAVASLTYS